MCICSDVSVLILFFWIITQNADEMAKLREKYRKAKNKVRRLKEELQTVTELNRDLQRALVRKEGVC